MSSELIVKLAPSAEPEQVRSDADGLGATLSPLHPGTEDPELATYFVARVEGADAERIAQGLMRLDGVDGAYVKPPAAPP